MSAGSTRPLRADARRNRELVLEAARELFGTDGLSVPIDEIAARAGVGAGTVHRHFPTKESLVAAVVVSRMDQLVEEARALAGTDDPGAAVLHMITRMLDEGADSAPLKAALAGTDFDIRTAAPDVASNLREAIATLLVNGQQAGIVRSDIDVEDLMALVAGAFTALQHAQADSDPGRGARITDVLFDGLRTKA